MSKGKRLLETVAEIAYIAGTKGHYSGDSRRDISDFIAWAMEFETHRREDAVGNETYFDKDYMTAIEEFANKKLSGHE